jgi:predicted Rossmann fold nucleotide-binding protein DprA/Smf involved in DNA uptake
MGDFLEEAEEFFKLMQSEALVREQVHQILSSSESEEEIERKKEQRLEESFVQFKKLLNKNLSVLSYNEEIDIVINWSIRILIGQEKEWVSRTTVAEQKRMRMFLILENKDPKDIHNKKTLEAKF